LGHAYTPGLRVTERTVLRKLRRLPLPGQVHVQPGDLVEATQVVASTQLPGSVTSLNVAREMNCQPDEVPGVMIKQQGDTVAPGEIIAESKALWGLFHSYVRSPLTGTIESVSEVTGQVLVRGEPTPVNLEAFVDGKVLEVRGQEAVLVACQRNLRAHPAAVSVPRGHADGGDAGRKLQRPGGGRRGLRGPGGPAAGDCGQGRGGHRRGAERQRGG